MRGLKNHRKPWAANVVGVADRIGQEFARDVDRRALVMNPVVSVDADTRLIEKVDVGRGSRRDHGRGRRHRVVDAERGHVRGRRRRNRQRRPCESRKESLPPRPHLNLNSAPRVNLNKGAHGSRQGRGLQHWPPPAQSDRVWRRRHTKDQKAEIISERRVKTIVAALAASQESGRETRESNLLGATQLFPHVASHSVADAGRHRWNRHHAMD